MQEYMNCEQRREKIVEFLIVHKVTTGDTLAREFNVSIRTITRDLTILSLTKPIITKRGNQGGISIAPGYKSHGRYLTLEQEQCLKKLSEEVSPDIRKILAEIIETFALIK